MSPNTANDNPPKTPEQWLETTAPEKTTGILKIFLGYAPGVGKTFNMLSEAIRRRKRCEDVVIGFVECHRRQAVLELMSEIERVPTRKVEYKGTSFEEMDLNAILARKPQVVLVDELAHTNIPGGNTKSATRMSSSCSTTTSMFSPP
jgi:two-component system sensor histidine kinase KdpD